MLVYALKIIFRCEKGSTMYIRIKLKSKFVCEIFQAKLKMLIDIEKKREKKG